MSPRSWTWRSMLLPNSSGKEAAAPPARPPIMAPAGPRGAPNFAPSSAPPRPVAVAGSEPVTASVVARAAPPTPSTSVKGWRSSDGKAASASAWLRTRPSRPKRSKLSEPTARPRPSAAEKRLLWNWSIPALVPREREEPRPSWVWRHASNSCGWFCWNQRRPAAAAAC